MKKTLLLLLALSLAFPAQAVRFELDKASPIKKTERQRSHWLVETLRSERGHVFNPYGRPKMRPAPITGEGSGLTKKLQRAIVGSLKPGEIIAVRTRPYPANFLDGKYPAKPAGAIVRPGGKFKNGVRILMDGSKVLSDVDIAFVVKNNRLLPEVRSLEIGEAIHRHYGHEVVRHGDNYSGARRGIKDALEVETKNETIYLFNREGWVDSGPYQTMLQKWGQP